MSRTRPQYDPAQNPNMLTDKSRTGAFSIRGALSSQVKVQIEVIRTTK